MIANKYTVSLPPIPVQIGATDILTARGGVLPARHWTLRRLVTGAMIYAPPSSNQGQPADVFIGAPGLPSGNFAQVPSTSDPRNPGAILDRQVLVEGTPTDAKRALYNSADYLEMARADYVSQAHGNTGLLPFFDLGDGTTRAAYILKFALEANGIHAIVSWTQAGLDSGAKFLIPHVNAGLPDADGNPGRVQGAPLCMGSLVKSAGPSALSNLVASAKAIASDERIPVSRAMGLACQDNEAYMAYRRQTVLKR